MQLEAERGEREIDDTLIIMKNLIETSVNTVIEKYHNRELRERIEKAMRILSESEVKELNNYLKLGIEIAGLNIPSLAPFVTDKLFLQYLGSILKVSTLIAVGVRKYWVLRAVRKLSVRVETVSRKIVEDMVKSLDKYGRKDTSKSFIEIVSSIINDATSIKNLFHLSEELHSERVHANTPEVIVFARELQELRKQFI